MKSCLISRRPIFGNELSAEITQNRTKFYNFILGKGANNLRYTLFRLSTLDTITVSNFAAMCQLAVISVLEERLLNTF